MTPTAKPLFASAIARLTDVLVLPTPPLPLITTNLFFIFFSELATDASCSSLTCCGLLGTLSMISAMRSLSFP